MSKALVCDQCAVVMDVNDNGDNEYGEEATWITLRASFGKFDLCSRACCAALLESSPFIASMDEQAVVIAEIARAVRDEPSDD